MRINAERGEVALTIGGERRTLCLTMGALAALERAFGCDDLTGLGARLRTMTQDDLRVVLDALLGEPVNPEDVDWSAAARACAACFRLAFAE
jgi:hypothetical protein